MDTGARYFAAETSGHRRLEPAVTLSGEAFRPAHAAASHDAKLVRSEHDAAAAMLALARDRRDRMIAISSQELRSHLAPIRSAADLIRLAAQASGQAQRAAAILERQVAEMTRLLDELVASVLSNAPQPTLRRVATTVQIVVALGADMAEPLMSARRQTLSIRMPVEPIYLEADPMWLTHALRNVIGNAVKYTDSGGHIGIRVERHGWVAVISVRDDGEGLSTDKPARLFDSYTQVDYPAKRPLSDESRVGLHLAELVLDAHGGSICALGDSPSPDTTFVIRLPIARRQDARVA